MRGLTQLRLVVVGATLGTLVGVLCVMPLARSTSGGVSRPTGNGAPEIHLRETFDLRALDAGLPSGWITVGAPGAFSIAALPTSVDRSLRITAPVGGAPARACLRFPPLREGKLRVEADLLLSGAQTGAATLLALRGGGAERAAVNGGEQVRWAPGAIGGAAFELDRWYASSLTAELATRRYVWDLRPVGAQTATIRGESALLHRGGTYELSELCFGEVSGGLSLYISTVVVERVD